MEAEKKIEKENVIERFGNVRYSCEQGKDYLFHTIKSEDWSAYIDEYEDEFICTVFNRGEVANSGVEVETVADLFNEIEKRIKIKQ